MRAAGQHYRVRPEIISGGGLSDIDKETAFAPLLGAELSIRTPSLEPSRVAQLRELTSALLQRISQFEASMSAPSPVQSQLVAKGYTRTDVPQRNVTASELMTRAQGVIDSPQQIGVLSSLLSEGKLEQVQLAVRSSRARTRRSS